jgi:hypothetical protein
VAPILATQVGVALLQPSPDTKIIIQMQRAARQARKLALENDAVAGVHPPIALLGS